MYVEQVMSNPVITVETDTPIGLAWEMLQNWHCRHLPVLTPGGTLAGIVSDRDLRAARAAVATSSEREPLVGEIMRTDIITAEPRTPIETACRQLVEYRVGALPVLDGTRLVGIVTETDLLGLLLRVLGLLEPAARIELDSRAETAFGEGVQAAFNI
jgi:acetoin utilization protein AcuB